MRVMNVTDIGTRRAADSPGMPELRLWQLPGPDAADDVVVSARLLSYVSSRRPEHTHDADFTPPGWKCSACRWIEIRILRTAEGAYVVHTVGQTVVPDERVRVTVDETVSPDEVVELLVLRRQHRVFLPQPSARALAAASAYDAPLRDAYRDRAVA